jgi:hypothetical protein
MRASISAMCWIDPVDQLLAEGVVLAWLLQALEEHLQVLGRFIGG